MDLSLRSMKTNNWSAETRIIGMFRYIIIIIYEVPTHPCRSLQPTNLCHLILILGVIGA